MSNTWAIAHDPVLRGLAERKARTEKIERVAAERRAGVSGVELIEQAATEFLQRADAIARGRATPAKDIVVDTSDLDPDLVDVGAEYSRRLNAAILGGMEKGYTDMLSRLSPELRADLLARDDAPVAARRSAADRERVRAELRQPKYQPPSKPEPKPVLTGTALIEEAAADFLAKLDAPKRRRR